MNPGRSNCRADRGQATVEIALLLPFVVLLGLAIVQAGLVARDRVLLTHATRSAARAAAVGLDDVGVRDAALRSSGLAPGRLQVTRTAAGRWITVELRYSAPTELAVVGRLAGDVELTEQLTIAAEQ